MTLNATDDCFKFVETIRYEGCSNICTMLPLTVELVIVRKGTYHFRPSYLDQKFHKRPVAGEVLITNNES
jgi:hypothetical protein